MGGRKRGDVARCSAVADVPMAPRSEALLGTYWSATQGDHVIYESRLSWPTCCWRTSIRRCGRLSLSRSCFVLKCEAGPPSAYNAGEDGRMVLDPLCHAVPDLLTPGGTFLVVHSEFCGFGETLRALRRRGLTAQIVASQRIPFGPVLTARHSGCRTPAG